MFEIDRQKFGSFVAQLRKEQGMTQKDLAEKLYISNKAISKWETGVSIPDVALLIPLSEALNITVTELLKCQRIPESQSLDPTQVEAIIKTAISYSEDRPRLSDMGLKKRRMIFLLCCFAACMEVALMFMLGYSGNQFSEITQITLVLCPLFGWYFMALAKDTLPPYYDEYRINGMLDGPFRMNIPGLRFSNHNWPYILKVGRIWSMTMLMLYPALNIFMVEIFPVFWHQYEQYIGLTLILGGLFVPMVIVGKKYE